jgi:trafficking protein particle complex subunit 8
MSTSKQPVSELIQAAFPPLVAALVSPKAEEACAKNNLNFVEMLQPFCTLPSDGKV